MQRQQAAVPAIPRRRSPFASGPRWVGGAPSFTCYKITTAAFNLTGHPAISVPCGLNSQGLPIGLQIAGRPLDEETVLRVAHVYESLGPNLTSPL